MDLTVKKFEKLSLQELYQILKIRSEVFVVEQNCIYQDIDGKDQNALHVIGKVAAECIAYSRIFPPGEYFKEAAIGRVVVQKDQREKKFGHQLLEASIDAVERIFGSGIIKLSAQRYLIPFYESHGFKAEGQGYLEDGIPHIAMVRK